MGLRHPSHVYLARSSLCQEGLKGGSLKQEEEGMYTAIIL